MPMIRITKTPPIMLEYRRDDGKIETYLYVRQTGDILKLSGLVNRLVEPGSDEAYQVLKNLIKRNLHKILSCELEHQTDYRDGEAI